MTLEQRAWECPPRRRPCRPIFRTRQSRRFSCRWQDANTAFAHPIYAADPCSGGLPCCSPRSPSTCPPPPTPCRAARRRIPTAEIHFVNGRPLKGPYPEGLETALLRHGLLLGRGADVLEAPGRLRDRGRLRGRDHAQPDLRGGLLGPHRPHRGRCWWSSTRKVVTYDDLLKVFWENHDPTQGMRQGNDIGTQYRSGIYVTNDAQAAAAEASREAYQQALSEQGLRPDHHRDRRRPGRSTSPRTITSSTWPRTRAATAASAAPA